MVERILEEKNTSTAAAKEFASLRRNTGCGSSSSSANNNASGSADSGVGGSNVSCSNTDNSCSQSQSGECSISSYFFLQSLLLFCYSYALVLFGFPLSINVCLCVHFISLHFKWFCSHCASYVHWNFLQLPLVATHTNRVRGSERDRRITEERGALHPFTLRVSCPCVCVCAVHLSASSFVTFCYVFMPLFV